MKDQIGIIVVSGGWVFVSRYAWHEDTLALTSAKCVRRWGTTQGLGQLAAGPTEATELDLAGRVDVPRTSVVAILSVEQAAWDGVLDGTAPPPKKAKK